MTCEGTEGMIGPGAEGVGVGECGRSERVLSQSYIEC